MTSPLDQSVHITVFPTLDARDRSSQYIPLQEFAEQLRSARAAAKQELKLFSACSYNNDRTAKGSLRHDGNVRECFAVIGDYDGGRVSPQEAADALHQARVAAIIVTTPSHTADRPRFRVIAPLQMPLHRDRPNGGGLGDHTKLVSRLAGILPANIAGESWTLSQSWYLGTVDGAADHQVLAIDGRCIDQCPELDVTARPKPPPAPKAQPKKKRQQQPASDDPAADPDLLAPLNIADALGVITQGGGSHEALVSLAGKFAQQGIPTSTAEAVLLHAIDQRAPDKRDRGWQQMRGDVRRVLAWAYEKHAQDEATMVALIQSTPQPRHSGNGATPPPPPPGSGPSGSPGGSTPPPQPGPAAPSRGLMRNRPPKYAGNLANVITALTTLPQLIGCVAFDEMAVAVTLQQPLPGDSTFTGSRAWTDNDTSRLQDVLQRDVQMARIGKETVQQGVEHVAHMYAFHPVRDYLNGLAWDGTPRLDSWLAKYLGVEASPYASATGRMWLIGLVARIMKAGCKFDYMLIVEGLQGSLKSQVCTALCGPWVSDQSLDIRHDARAASQHLRNKWLVEVSELTFFRPADVESLKAFISRTHERYLPRYARNEVTEPRQCGFIGSTNRETYLHDPTGGRRFWPHRTGRIDIRGLMRDRGQLWAEAVTAYRAGEHWWPEQEFEANTIRPEQEARYDVDSWAGPIGAELERIRAATAKQQAAWAKQPEPKPPRPMTRTTLLQVWQTALTDPDAPGRTAAVNFDRPSQIRVRDILQFCGWRRSARDRDGRWWEWPE